MSLCVTCNIFYKDSSKKLRKLKNLYPLLKDQYEMYGAGVKPDKATGTRWIDHKLRATQKVVDKYGLYSQHLQNVIADTSKQTDRATLEGKFKKLIDASVLLRGAVFIDVLAEAKAFSLKTQKDDTNIIDIVESLELMKRNYERLLKRARKDENYVLKLPTLKSVVGEIEDDEHSEQTYQDQKVKRYLQEKRFIKHHAVHIIERIISSIEERYGKVSSEENVLPSKSKYEVSDEGDSVIFDVCCILNTNVLPNLEHTGDQDDDEDLLQVQLSAVKHVYDRLSRMDAFSSVTLDEIIDSYIRYGNCYFNLVKTNPLDLWCKLGEISSTVKTDWKGVMLILELCLCVPFSNATLEHFFSHMKLVKNEKRNRLLQKSLNSALTVRMAGITLLEFDATHVHKCVEFWSNKTKCGLNQGKRKAYKKHAGAAKKWKQINMKEDIS